MADATTDLANTASDMARDVSKKLKSAGVDTDVMVGAAKEQASELQRLIVDEVVKRPFQSLALAAALGFWYGLKLR